MTSFAIPPLFDALSHSRNVLVAGVGGGFDVCAGLPVAIVLAGRGVDAPGCTDKDSEGFSALRSGRRA